MELLHRGLVYEENSTNRAEDLFPDYRDVYQKWEVFKHQRLTESVPGDSENNSSSTTSPALSSTPQSVASEIGAHVPLAAIWLCAIAEDAGGLSGRGLRKLPFQAFAFYVKRQSCSLEYYLRKLLTAVKAENSHREDLKSKKTTGAIAETERH